MEQSIEFTKYKACFVCQDGGWQLSKNKGFHKCSSSRDYMVWWAEKDNQWSLYITNYYASVDVGAEPIHILTLDTVFDVMDYMCNNKHIHY